PRARSRTRSRVLCAWPTEEAGWPDQQDDRRDEVEHGELDLGEPRDASLADDADDERPHERALEAAEPAHHDDDEREDDRVDPHTEHRRLAGDDDGAAEPRHGAAGRERRAVAPVPVAA